MAGETPPTVPTKTSEAEPTGPNPKEPPVGVNIFDPTTENHTPDQASEDMPGDLVMQFVVQNFEQINAMGNPTSVYNNDDPPVIEQWLSDLEGSPEDAVRQAPEETTLQAKPSKKNQSTTEDHNGFPKKRYVNSADFYEPFTFTETHKNVHNLVASPFIARIRDYDMPDGLKVPTNRKAYDDVHKLPKLAWCRFFHITLSGAAQFWYGNLPPGSINGFHELRDKFRANFLQQRRFQKTQAEILGIRQRSDESLRDYLGRFGKEMLHMTDRSDGMMTGAFISGLRPGRLFKDLIARPPASMEDLFTQAHNFIWADESNAENRLQDGKWGTNDGRHTQNYRDTSKKHKERHVACSTTRPNERSSMHKPTFTPLIKSRAEIYATSEGKSVL
ncbi:gag protein [Artemisia annua]|uniref:Gag protein n=1 Tax=Artemisia annua TaxID=35608 RepID=A0A2U1KTB5_ARTAN|nr:gag protein [Artemisia annua]